MLRLRMSKLTLLITAMTRYVVGVILILVLQVPVLAQNIAEKEAVTPKLFHIVAKEQRVPASVLYALVLAESQTFFSGQANPWPWTINHAGSPYFFEKRVDAVIFARNLLNKDDSNFDVGLGQINWRFHNRSFESLYDAFEPKTNLEVAARFLRQQFRRGDCPGWVGAIGCYHKPNQKEAKNKLAARKYTKRVMDIWNNLERRETYKDLSQ